MDAERWRQIDTIFKSAVGLPSGERAEFVERACGDDETLRAEVLSLIEHDRGGGTLGAPAVEEAARVFAAERERERSLAGRAVGAYRVVSRVGAGGMGEIYLAVHERTGRKVALKLLPDHFAGDEARVRRFRQEARAVLRLNHPNIVTVYDIEQTGAAGIIASEYIEGETLRERLSRGPLAPAEALDVAAQIAAALSAAHAEGVVHRDVKPENVMLRPDGFVKVLDFGLAKLNEGAGAQTSQAPTRPELRTDPGVVMGTVSYMSPEQARAREVDARTDIWSLGVVLYEMLTGRAPFRGESQADVLAAVVGAEPAPLSRHLPAAPDALEWVVTKALTKDRDGRYQTAKELLTDLRRLKQQLEFEAAASRSGGALTTEAGPATVPNDAPGDAAPRARTTAADAPQSQTGEPAARQTSSAEVILGELKRHRRGALVAAALIVCALAAAGFGLYRLTRGTNAPPAPFQKFGVRRLGDTGQAVDAALSPDGEFVAYVKDEAGRQSLWLRETSAASSVQIVPAAEGQRIRAPLFSLDGVFVYYLKAQPRGHLATLYRTPKLGGAETKLVEGVSLQDTRSNFALSPDGRQLAFIRLDERLNRSLVVTNHDGSGARVLYRRDLPEFLSGAAWSPDGRVVACVRGTFQGPKAFVAVNVSDGSVGQITNRTWKSVGGFAWAGASGALVAAAAQSGEVYQLWRLPYPEGEPQRITNDVSTYTSVSLSSDSSVLATVQTNVVQNVWTAPAAAAGGAAPPAQLTFGAGRYDGQRGVAWAPGGRIVYHSLAGGSDDIWITNADGTGQRQLTDGASTHIYPDVSPDGRHVVFSANDPEGNSGLWRMNLDGSDAKLLMPGGALPSVSPDSRWAVCYRHGPPVTVWRVPLEGGEPERVRLPEGAQAGAPFISPDGRLVAYNYRTAEPGSQWLIAVFPFEGDERPLKVFEVVGSPVRQLRWTPDGRAVCHIDTRQNVSNILCLPLDGGPAFPVTDFKSDFIDSFDWSPDGRRLALARGSGSSGVVLISDSK